VHGAEEELEDGDKGSSSSETLTTRIHPCPMCAGAEHKELSSEEPDDASGAPVQFYGIKMMGLIYGYGTIIDISAPQF
jgi:hypothetical protein